MSQRITQQVAKISGDSEHDLQFQIVAEDDIPIINQNQTKINSFELDNNVMYIRFQSFEETQLVHQVKQLLVQLLTSQETEALKILKTFEEVMSFAQGKHHLRAVFVHLHRAIKVNDLQPLEQINSSLNRPFFAALTAPRILPAPILDANKTTLHFNNPLKPTLLAIADVSLACQDAMNYEVLKQDVRQIFFKVRQLYNMSIYFDIDHLEANREQCIATFLLESPNRGTITGQVFVRAANAIPILQTFRVFPVQSPVRPPLPGEQLFQSPTAKKVVEQARQYVGTLVDRVPQAHLLALVATGITYYDVQFKYERMRQIIRRDTGIDACILVRTYELPADQTKAAPNSKGGTTDVRSTQHYPALIFMIYANTDEEVVTIRTTYGMGKRSDNNPEADAVKYLYLDEKSTIAIYLGTDIVSHHNLRYNTLFKVNGYVLDGISIAALPHLGQIIRDSTMIAAELTNPHLVAVFPALSFNANASGEVNQGVFGIHFVFTNGYSIPVTREIDPLVKTLNLLDENGRPISQVTYARFDNAYKRLPKHMQPRHMLSTLKFNGRIPPQLKPSHIHEAKKTYAPQETRQVFTPVSDTGSYLSRLTANTNELTPPAQVAIPSANAIQPSIHPHVPHALLATNNSGGRHTSNNIYNAFPMDEEEDANEAPQDAAVPTRERATVPLTVDGPYITPALARSGVTHHHRHALPVVTAPVLLSRERQETVCRQNSTPPAAMSSATSSVGVSLTTTVETHNTPAVSTVHVPASTLGGPTDEQLNQLLNEACDDLRRALSTGRSGENEMMVLREVQAFMEWQTRRGQAHCNPVPAPEQMRPRILQDLQHWRAHIRLGENLSANVERNDSEDARRVVAERVHHPQPQNSHATSRTHAQHPSVVHHIDPDSTNYLMTQETLATGAGGFTQSQRTAALVYPEQEHNIESFAQLRAAGAGSAAQLHQSSEASHPVAQRMRPSDQQSSQHTLATGAAGLTQSSITPVIPSPRVLQATTTPCTVVATQCQPVALATYSITASGDADTAAVLAALVCQQPPGDDNGDATRSSTFSIYQTSSYSNTGAGKSELSANEVGGSVAPTAGMLPAAAAKPLTAKQRKVAAAKAKQAEAESKVSTDQAQKAARLTATPKAAEKPNLPVQRDSPDDSDSSITTPGSQSLLFPIFAATTISSSVPMDVQDDDHPRGTKRDLEKRTTAPQK